MMSHLTQTTVTVEIGNIRKPHCGIRITDLPLCINLVDTCWYYAKIIHDYNNIP